MWKEIAVLGLLVTAPIAPLSAQLSDLTAEDALDQARRSYGPPPPRRQCKEDGTEDEIVVCAEEQHDYSEFRVKSTAEEDPTSRAALNDGVPRAPDVSGLPNCDSGCVGIGLGKAPPEVYMFDLSKLPDAPEGSDADLIAKGQKPAD